MIKVIDLAMEISRHDLGGFSLLTRVPEAENLYWLWSEGDAKLPALKGKERGCRPRNAGASGLEKMRRWMLP